MGSTNRTAFVIALRYLFSKKKHNIINIISVVSVLGIMASTAALIIVLSVFNGMQDLIVSSFNRFNPPIKIEAKEGKVFSATDYELFVSDIEKIEGVKAVERVISDLVLVTYYDKQTLITLYGISDKYPSLSGLEAMTIDGVFDMQRKNNIVFGVGVAGLLGINLNHYEPVKLYYPKRTKKNFVNPVDAFQTILAVPVGVFSNHTQYDENSGFVTTTLANELFDYETETSFIAVYFDEGISLKKVQKKIEQLVGDGFTVLDQMQQEPLLFKTIKVETLIAYLILCFIFVIAAFNIIGILGMLIIEKKHDISVLHTLGASKSLLKKLFLMVGAMIGIFGGVLGICIGFICCLAQQYFQIISMGGAESAFITSSYPVSMAYLDFVMVFLVIVVLSTLTSEIFLRRLKIMN